MSASLPDDRPRPADLADVRLLPGYFKDIQELHRTNVVGLLEPDRLLFPFRKQAGLPASDVGGDLRGGGNPPLQPPVIRGKSPTLPDLSIAPDPAMPLRFHAQMSDPAQKQGVRVSLSPFYRVHHQRYAVYWKCVAVTA